ncbi:hydroxymethylbilane synthase [Phenylobacterium montanum]|uniref:Porphobilinogen deaminase n=2 Tax=Phenylobacterium montanum TaxID=2823693 RepID=A0A975FXJ2_9CAUL|nr:hydroxymethylbilane synthase [Caulobacter sp. S6]
MRWLHARRIFTREASPVPQPIVRIGTRGSKLALTQAGHMQRRIAAALGYGPEDAEAVAPLVRIVTTGDHVQDRRLLEIGGKALFTKEIEEAMLDGRVDCAVHSMKDVPVERRPGLVLAAIPEREDPRDAFVSPNYARLADLPQGARLGTASLRRQAQALNARPDLEIVMVRGNVDTRLAKLERGEADGMLLALAGLKRLGLDGVVRSALDPQADPPAPGQGALAIETPERLSEADWVRALRHAPTAIAVAAERGALEALEGSCRTAIGAHARLEGSELALTVEALTPDGRERFRREGRIAYAADGEAAARALGERLGAEIRQEGGERLLLSI